MSLLLSLAASILSQRLSLPFRLLGLLFFTGLDFPFLLLGLLSLVLFNLSHQSPRNLPSSSSLPLALQNSSTVTFLHVHGSNRMLAVKIFLKSIALTMPFVVFQVRLNYTENVMSEVLQSVSPWVFP